MGNTIQQGRNSNASAMLERNQTHPLLWNKKSSSMETNKPTRLIVPLVFWPFILTVFISYCRMYKYSLSHIDTYTQYPFRVQPQNSTLPNPFLRFASGLKSKRSLPTHRHIPEE